MAYKFNTSKIKTNNSATRKAEAVANERIFNEIKKKQYSGDFMFARPGGVKRQGFSSGLVKANIHWRKHGGK